MTPKRRIEHLEQRSEDLPEVPWHITWVDGTCNCPGETCTWMERYGEAMRRAKENGTQRVFGFNFQLS